MKVVNSLRSSAYVGLPLLAAAMLSACVVVPVDPKTGQPYGHAPQPSPVVVVQQPAATTTTAATPQVTVLTARMYPVNDVARTSGLLNLNPAVTPLPTVYPRV